MKKEEIIALWQEKMQGTISQENEQLLTQYLNSERQLEEEFSGLADTWHKLDLIKTPTPSSSMDVRFQQMLSKQIRKAQPSPNLVRQFFHQLQSSWQLGLASLLVGIFIGWGFSSPSNTKNDLKELSTEIQSIKQMMVLTLIEQPKAQERIRAVNLVSELPQADQKIIDALISTLHIDANVNVRLAALESLVRYADEPAVRQALVETLARQESPLMQVAVADILVQIQEKSSLEVMKNLKNSVMDDFVKEKLTESIHSLQKS